MPQNPTSHAYDEAQRRAISWLFALGIVVAVLIAYYPVWHAGFIWDDDKYVTENPLLTGQHRLQRIWLSRDAPSQYFPLTYTTFLIERALWGLNAAGYHRINFFLHAANALLAWQLLLRLRVPGAWLAAAIWALHPVQVETVAWVTELKNLLMAFFFLLSLHAWIKFLDNNVPQSPCPGSAGVPPAPVGVPPMRLTSTSANTTLEHLKKFCGRALNHRGSITRSRFSVTRCRSSPKQPPAHSPPRSC